MNTRSNEMLHAARAEMHAAHAIAWDPNCDEKSAAKHVVDAWLYLRAFASEDERDAGWDAKELPDWLRGLEERILSRKAREAVLADLPAWMDLALPHALVRSERGSDVSRQSLLGQVQALRRAICEMSPVPDLQARLFRTRRWGRRLAVGAAVVGVVYASAFRPWEAFRDGPWRGAYYPSENFDGKPTVRRDKNIDFDWGVTAPMDDIPADRFGVRWDSCLVLDVSQEVVFQLVSDDGSRLYVNGERIIDNWGRGPRKSRGERIALDAGIHHIQVEYYEWKEEAMISLMASFGGEEKPSSIPGSMLRHPRGDLGDDDPCGDD
jgi:hypothetical protein